ncbi:SGNH/GDSL hydrolase family protein [Bacillus sp. FJAT-44742]|uniref:SGNH/GDSL hydrolase family protein n=1 Tax=Bacillus sp. FJAT-44742 TaxID=2014005 RepID=UPI000C241A65|nr:SGNH/GDSL hydrolase family protein [Bacillus sp. FJAT-44742]
MKTVLSSLLLVVSFIFFCSPVTANSDQGKMSLVALGDSIPYGYNLGVNDNASFSRNSYPFLIGKALDMRVRNLAVPGLQTEVMLYHLENDQKYRQAVRHADYITLTIGSNDLLEALRIASTKSLGDNDRFLKYLNKELENTNLFENLSESVEEIRTLTDSPIIIYNVYNPYQKSNDLFLHNIGNEILPIINEEFRDLLDHYDNIDIADAHEAFGTNQEDYVIENDIHPTTEGQRILADVGIQVLNPYFED